MSDDRTLLVWDCPNCGCRRMKRVKVGSDNSRNRIEGGQTFRRRYECVGCGARATSYEVLPDATVTLPGETLVNRNEFKVTEKLRILK